jgi:hypothetical protein
MASFQAISVNQFLLASGLLASWTSPPMHVISTYLPPTAVTHAITAKLTAGSARYLVIAKINRVEVFSLERDGLKKAAAYELWGRIVALEEIVVDVSYPHMRESSFSLAFRTVQAAYSSSPTILIEVC